MTRSVSHRRYWSVFLLLWSVLAVVIRWHVYGLDKQVQREGISSQVVISARSVLIDMIDIETGLRGYLIEGRKEFLQPYHEGVGRLTDDFSALRARVAGDAAERSACRDLTGLISSIRAEFVAQIDLVDMSGIDAARKRFRENPTKPVMDHVRERVTTIQAEEDRKLVVQKATLDRSIATTLALTDAATVATVLIALALASSLLNPPGSDYPPSSPIVPHGGA